MAGAVAAYAATVMAAVIADAAVPIEAMDTAMALDTVSKTVMAVGMVAITSTALMAKAAAGENALVTDPSS